jgi:hypothetical protein
VDWFRGFEPFRNGDTAWDINIGSLATGLGRLLGIEERHERGWFLTSSLGLLYTFLVVEHLVVKFVRVHLDSLLLFGILLEGRGVAESLEEFLRIVSIISRQ